MTVPPLPYATKPTPFSGLRVSIAEDEVGLTKAPPRGVLLGTLITLTILYAALWTMFVQLALKLGGLGRSFGSPAFFWYGLASLLMPALPALLWTIGTAVGWYRYWHFGAVPLQIRVTREGMFVSRPGALRAISTSHYAPGAVRSVDVRPVRGSLTRTPICEIKIRIRWRLPLAIRTSQPVDGLPRAFVDHANELLKAGC